MVQLRSSRPRASAAVACLRRSLRLGMRGFDGGPSVAWCPVGYVSVTGVRVRPETRYAKSGSVSVAYQVIGDGPVDLVLVPGFVSHVEVAWEEPRLARFLTRLASFARLIVFDKRGTG